MKKRFCTYCGSEMIEFIGDAENYAHHESNKTIPAAVYGITNKAYDKETGAKMKVKAYRCPKDRWWSSKHDSYSIGKPFKHNDI